MSMKESLLNIKSLFQHYRTSTAILRKLLKNPLTFEESGDMIRNGLEMRKVNFLSMLRRCIFENPKSPHKALLDHAGYTFGDIESLVNRIGLEEALKKLYSDGVYVDIQEFKGKKPAIRGKRTFTFTERDFNNHLLSSGFDIQTGGTTGRSVNVRVPLEFIRHNAIYGIYASSLYNIPGKKVIIWLPILPALEGLFFNLRFGIAGFPPVKWYSQTDPDSIKPLFIDRMKTISTILLARRYGINLPAAEFIDMRETNKIAKWMSQNDKGNGGYAVVTYASSALRLVVEARKEGFRLGDTVFWLMGEPLTPKKRQVIEEYGCKAFSLYGCNELMLIGHGCENPGWVDDLHFFEDKLAVIQHHKKIDHSEDGVGAFLFTTLLDISPKIFLNTELGDYGVIETRKCGCRFEEVGLKTHMHSIRSFEKLTAEGVTFIGSNIIPLVEEILPATFGGSAVDYQFVEEEDEEGHSKVYALVDPKLGEIDEAKLKEITYTALSGSKESQRGSKLLWDQVGTFQFLRVSPIPTKRGKILPFYIRRGVMPLLQRQEENE